MHMPAPHSRLNKPFHAAAYRYTRGWISLSSRVCSPYGLVTENVPCYFHPSRNTQQKA